MKYIGNLISATPPSVTTAGASGVWSLNEQARYQGAYEWPFIADPYFNQTTLLLHGNSSYASEGVCFADSSSNEFAITLNGDVRSTQFSPYMSPEGYWSNYFDGTGDEIYAAANSSAFSPGTGDVTVEGWFYFTNLSAGVQNLFGCNNGSGSTQKLVAYVETNGTIHWDITQAGGASKATSSSGEIVNGQWYHLAFVRSSGTAYIYKNGISIASGASTDNLSNLTNPFYVGYVGEAYGVRFSGYVSSFRYVKGTAVYTSNFTPPTTPLTAVSGTALLTCQSNRFVDNSTNNFAITANGDTKVAALNPFDNTYDTVYGSGYFDGSGDYLNVGTITALGSGDFTISCWVYPQGISRGVFHVGGLPSSVTGVAVFLSGTAAEGWGLYAKNSQAVSNTGAITLNEWYYLTVIRSGTTTTLYVDGVSAVVISSDSTNYTQTSLAIGGFYSTSYLMFGYISNFRIVSSALTATAPTTPLTAVSGTSLLTCTYSSPVNNNGFLDSGPYNYPITRLGNSTQGSFTPWSLDDGWWSNYFDGSGDSLTLAANTAFQFDGDFTVEFWFNSNSNTTASHYDQIVGTIAGATTGYWRIGSEFNGAKELWFTWTTGTYNDIRTGFSISDNEWHHIAVTRISNSVRMFVDGVQKGITTTVTTALTNNAALNVMYSPQSADYTSGYVSNLRIIKGTGLYSSDFTPPTAPLEVVTSTSLLTCQSNRFIDNSSNAFAITKNGDSKITNFSPFAPDSLLQEYTPATKSGSGYFDGTGDWLTTSNAVGLGLSTQTWTISCWFYNKNSAGFHILSISPNTSNVSSFSIDGANSRPFLQIYTGGTNRVLYGGTTGSVRTNEWNHIALCHLGGGQYQFYLNGVAQTASSATGWYFNQSSAGTTTGIAVYSYNNTGLLTGYMSDLVVKPGVDGSVPTAPVTSDGSEYLLLNFQNAGVYDSTGKNNLETVADSKVDLSTVKYGLGSLKFDGTGDYLLLPSSQDLSMGTGDFTIEMWVNLSASGANDGVLVEMRSTGASTTGFVFNTRPVTSPSTGFKLNFYTDGGANLATTILAYNTWHHVAVTRASGSVRLFANGVSDITPFTKNNNFSDKPNVTVGQSTLYASSNITGFIDDLRITKGVARYTTTFTPPTRQLLDI